MSSLSFSDCSSSMSFLSKDASAIVAVSSSVFFSAADEVGAVTDCHRGCEFRQQKRPQLAPSCGICQQNRDCLVARADVNGKKRTHGQISFGKQIGRHYRKAALRHEPYARAQQRSESAPQSSAGFQFCRSFRFQNFDKHVYEKQKRQYFQTVQQSVQQYFTHAAIIHQNYFSGNRIGRQKARTDC